MNDGARISSALLLSVVVHALALSLLSAFSFLGQMPLTTPHLLDVDLVSLPSILAPPPVEAALEADPVEPPIDEPAEEPPPRVIPVPEQQIVSPSEGGQATAPEDTRLLSDRDASVKEQMVRRGEPAPAPGATDGTVKDPSEGGARSDSQAPFDVAARGDLPGINELLPSPARLAREGYDGAEAKPDARAKGSGQRPDLLAHGDTWHAQTHRPGTLDFLPDVREGDITLLNTKAELFSPFVRRVAIRVFGHLVILLRRSLESSQISSREWVTLEAVMNNNGDLISLDVKDHSYSSALDLDRKLQRACYEGFFDRNPPGGAETADGNIHFLFTTQVMSLVGDGGRSIGYRAMFSAGLL